MLYDSMRAMYAEPVEGVTLNVVAQEDLVGIIAHLF